MPPGEPSVADQLLATATLVLEGGTPVGSLDALLSRVEEGHQRFAARALGNPEAEPELVQAVLQAFERSAQGLREMVAATSHSSLKQAAAAVLDAARRIQSQQQAHVQATRKMGPTPFPDANRALLHLRSLREGFPDARFALLAFEDLAGLQERTRHDLDEREQRSGFRAAREQALEAARCIETLALHAAATLQHWSHMDKPSRRATIEDLDARFREQFDLLVLAMQRYVAAEASSGPTASRPVNNLLRAVERFESGHMNRGDMTEFLLQVEDALPLSSPLRRPVIHLRVAVSSEDAEEMAIAVVKLSQLGNRPLSHTDDEDEEALDFVVGEEGVRQAAARAPRLPRNFLAAVNAVEAFLSYPSEATAEAAEGAIQALAAKLRETRAAAERPGRPPAVVAKAHGAFACVEEALASLADAIESKSWVSLEAAQESLARATVLLSALSQRQPRLKRLGHPNARYACR